MRQLQIQREENVAGTDDISSVSKNQRAFQSVLKTQIRKLFYKNNRGERSNCSLPLVNVKGYLKRRKQPARLILQMQSKRTGVNSHQLLQGKFKLNLRKQLFPGHCAGCRTSHRRGFQASTASRNYLHYQYQSTCNFKLLH